MPLDWAITDNIPYIPCGRWCPAGQRGRWKNSRATQETPERDYQQRTKWNARDGDAALSQDNAACRIRF
ncbi:putative molybdenum carrier protein [Nitrosospira sp. Nsp13]|uniref:YpsA SLOG family protein n=1 Tax=Nitrosospira sp. Nsp13 TaxID=1855332 RepID=UPI000B854562